MSRAILRRLAAGQPPDVHSIAKLMVGFQELLDDWRRDLDGFIAARGSALRILSAPAGRGKTHLSRTLQAEAAVRKYLICQVDAAADHADDDLSLYRAFCSNVRHPESVLEGVGGETGLGAVLQRIASDTPEGAITEAEVRSRLKDVRDVPAPALLAILPALLDAIGRVGMETTSHFSRDDISVVLQLISGAPVGNTRALGRLRAQYDGPVLRRLRKTPGKRDARLWLETMLRVLPAFGFGGVLWILDEHDQTNPNLLDRHIVQLRRFADRLVEGRVPGVFALYLVLDDFRSRLVSHVAVQQRLQPLLPAIVPRRVLMPLDHVRGSQPGEFFSVLGSKIHSLGSNGTPSDDFLAFCDSTGRACTVLGGPNVRAYVRAVATRVLDRA